MRSKIQIAIGIVAVAMIFFWPATSGAVNTGTVGILPAYPNPSVAFSNSWCIYNLDLGQSKRDAIRVLNNRAETTVVKLYPVDATTTTDGSFAPLGEDETRKDLGSWIKLAANEVEIPPNSEKLVPFEISIPKNADVGDHMGAIVMQELETGANIQGTGTHIITRVAVRAYETVPGTVRKDFDITRLDWRMDPAGKKSFFKDFLDLNKQTLFFIGLKNNGNVKITPHVTMDVKNIFGQTVAHIPDQEVGVLFPNRENRDGVVTWSGMPIIGRYTARATVNFVEGGVGEKTQEIVIWVFPYRIAFLLVLLLVFVALLRLILKYRLEVSKEKMPIYKVKNGDTVLAVAQKHGVSWKRLVAVNGLKKPFEVSKGQKLFIPITKQNRQELMEMFKRGEVMPSLSGSGTVKKGKLKVIVIGAIFIVLIGGWFAYSRYKISKLHLSEQPAESGEQAPAAPQETSEKTISGAFKKSSLSVGIFTPSGADPTSSQRLLNKFLLAGYKVKLLGMGGQKYQKTTIEYLPGKKDQAAMIQNDLGIQEKPDLVEMEGLSEDADIYNFAAKEEFLQMNFLPSDVTPQRDLIKVTLFSGGADEATLKNVKDLVTLGGFVLQKDEIQTASSNISNLSIVYSDDSQTRSAEVVKNYFDALGYNTVVAKAKGEAIDGLKLIVGKT